MTPRERARRAIERCQERDGTEPATRHVGAQGGACEACIAEAIGEAMAGDAPPRCPSVQHLVDGDVPCALPLGHEERRCWGLSHVRASWYCRASRGSGSKNSLLTWRASAR